MNEVPNLRAAANAALLTRFNRKLEKREGADGCWLWRGGLSSSKLPIMLAGKKQLAVNRLSYASFCGPIPANHFVRAKCENKHCVRPEHLFITRTPGGFADGGFSVAEPRTQSVPVSASVSSGPASPRSVGILSPDVLAAIDRLSHNDAATIEDEIGALELRVRTLRALHSLVLNLHRPLPGPTPSGAVEHARAVMAPARAPSAKRPRRPVKRTKSGSLRDRLLHFLSSRQSHALPSLVSATGATETSIDRALRCHWFQKTGDTFQITDAGMSAVLEAQ